MDRALKKLVDEFLSAQFARFFFAALSAALVNFVARILLDPYIGYNKAIVVSYVIGTVFAFFLYQREVFGKGTRPFWQEAGMYLFVTLAAMAQTLIVSVLLADYVFPYVGWHWYGKEIAHIVGMAVPMFSSFLGHKYLTFSHEPVDN